MQIKHSGAVPSKEPKVTLKGVFVLLIFAFLLFLLFFRAYTISARFSTYVTPEQVVVAAPGGLPAFHIIEKAQITLVEKPTQANAFLKIEDVEGHYLLQPLAAGEVIQASHLSSISLSGVDMSSRRILSVPLATGAFRTDIVKGAHVTLLLSPRSTTGTEPPASVEVDAIVLMVDQEEAPVVLTVAIDNQKIKEVGAILGISDVFILQAIP